MDTFCIAKIMEVEQMTSGHNALLDLEIAALALWVLHVKNGTKC
jgi:hypothetical protein